MRAPTLAVSVAVLCASGLAPLRASAAEPNMVYVYVQLMNNYIGRGLSQSVGQPSAQVEVDVNPGSGLYGNLSAVHIGWIDKVYPGDSVHVEIDGVIGWREYFGRDGELKVGVLQLQFPGRYCCNRRQPSVRTPRKCSLTSAGRD